MMKRRDNIHPYIPFWVGAIYGTLASVTIPWALYLAIKLPQNHLSTHWDLAWVGFDIGLSLALAATAWLALRKSKLLIMAATITATLLVVDAWFDIITAHSGTQLDQSITLALFAELPLAFITYRLAYIILAKELRATPEPAFHNL